MILQITRGDVQIPKWLSSGAQKMIKRILDPNPVTRITVSEIKADQWFKQGYVQSSPDDEEEIVYIDEEAFSINDEVMFELYILLWVLIILQVCILWKKLKVYCLLYKFI